MITFRELLALIKDFRLFIIFIKRVFSKICLLLRVQVVSFFVKKLTQVVNIFVKKLYLITSLYLWVLAGMVVVFGDKVYLIMCFLLEVRVVRIFVEKVYLIMCFLLEVRVVSVFVEKAYLIICFLSRWVARVFIQDYIYYGLAKLFCNKIRNINYKWTKEKVRFFIKDLFSKIVLLLWVVRIFVEKGFPKICLLLRVVSIFVRSFVIFFYLVIKWKFIRWLYGGDWRIVMWIFWWELAKEPIIDDHPIETIGARYYFHLFLGCCCFICCCSVIV